MAAFQYIEQDLLKQGIGHVDNPAIYVLGANFEEIDDFTEGWEGGATDDLSDNASKFPVPGTHTYIKKGKQHTSSHWHTNKGVTWQTFVANGKRLNYLPTPALFFKMPKDLWLKIAKARYWDVINLDEYKSQAIANIMFSWQWGSGYGWQNRISRYLKTKGITWIPGVTKGSFKPIQFKLLAQIFNQLAAKAEKTIFLELIEQKRQFLQSLDDWPKYGKGWTNRLEDLKSKSLKFVTENPGTTATGGVFFFSLIALAIWKRKAIAAALNKKPQTKTTTLNGARKRK